MGPTYRTVVGRALAAGLVAGVALSLHLLVVVEPVLDDAIALEAAQGAAAAGPADGGHGHGDHAPFTRHQQVVGGMAATLLYGLLAALTFGTVYAAVRHRLPARRELPRVLVLAAATFGTVALVPALKYPANPPGVGDPATVDRRAVLYLVLLAVSVAVAVALFHLSGRLRRAGVGDAPRTVVVAAATTAAYGLVLKTFPATPDTVPPWVPADLVWQFRVRSLGGLALLWLVTGLVLGWSLERAGDRPAVVAPAGVPS